MIGEELHQQVLSKIIFIFSQIKNSNKTKFPLIFEKKKDAWGAPVDRDWKLIPKLAHDINRHICKKKKKSKYYF